MCTEQCSVECASSSTVHVQYALSCSVGSLQCAVFTGHGVVFSAHYTAHLQCAGSSVEYTVQCHGAGFIIPCSVRVAKDKICGDSICHPWVRDHTEVAFLQCTRHSNALQCSTVVCCTVHCSGMHFRCVQCSTICWGYVT